MDPDSRTFNSESEMFPFVRTAIYVTAQYDTFWSAIFTGDDSAILPKILVLASEGRSPRLFCSYSLPKLDFLPFYVLENMIRAQSNNGVFKLIFVILIFHNAWGRDVLLSFNKNAEFYTNSRYTSLYLLIHSLDNFEV